MIIALVTFIMVEFILVTGYVSDGDGYGLGKVTRIIPAITRLPYSNLPKTYKH